MDWQDNFQEHIQLLQQAREADLTNPFVCHGIVHIFQEAFDMGLMAFREALKRDGQGMAAMGSAKELDRKSTRLNSSHSQQSRMPSSA